MVIKNLYYITRTLCTKF